VKRFIRIVEKFHVLNNFATREAILAGLNSSVIQRLKATWELVSPKSKATFSSLTRFLDRENHFLGYRQSLKLVNPPCIPFIGIYLSDITFINQGNSSQLDNGRLINFDKYARLAVIVDEIRRLQSQQHRYAPLEDIQNFLKVQIKSGPDLNALYIRSLEIEPRELPSIPQAASI
jgi:son of sevenless-like protein